MTKNKQRWASSFIIFLCIVSLLFPLTLSVQAKTETTTEYLVGFKKGIDSQEHLKKSKKIKHQQKKKFNTQNTIMMDLDAAEISELSKDPNVTFVEKNEKISIQTIQISESTEASGQTSNSIEILPWGNVAVGANLQQEGDLQGEGIKVAVLDTGISSHPDLVIKGGVSFDTSSTNYTDNNGHGTHVAGIIAAQQNTIGVVGIAPKVDLYGVKVLNDAGNGTYAQVIQGIEWAIDNNMNIISMSFSGTADSQALHQVISQAQQAGILLIAAAGNLGSGTETETYPALYPEVVSVGATTESNQRANLSSTGDQLDIVAPGVNILSTYKDGGYTSLSGTSMAAPYVTGAAAVVWSQHRSENALTIMNSLYDQATPLGPTHEYGHGLVNLARTLGLIDSAIPAFQLNSSDNSEPQTPGDSEVSISAIVRGNSFTVSTTAPSNKPSYTKVDIGVDGPKSRVCSKTITTTTSAGSTVSLSCTSTSSWDLGTYTPKYTFYYSGGTVPVTGASFTLTPEAPTLSNSYTPARTSIYFTWSRVNGVSSYKIIKNGELAATLGDVNNYTLTGLSPSSTYYIQVKAVDPNDTSSGSYSNTVSMTTKPPFGTPGTPTISNVAANGFSVSWSGVSDADQYKVLIDGQLKATVSTTSTPITGLNPNQQYSVQIKAIDQFDANNVTFSPIVNQLTAKSAGPQGFTATFVTANTIKVTWSPVSDPTIYSLTKSNNGSSETPYSTSSTVFYFTGLNPGVAYTLKVFTVNTLPSQITVTTDGVGNLPGSIPLMINGQPYNAIPFYPY
ncbi:S8 family serine peptidase [Cohnella silvisoli]|uniref:S8 family serine peptidase n=1 Tax=Cohnella silvisoli TaxID=2873699 RepID=A0ABV1KZZ4_9BACL|nr:S8 family serine peptidase [Cohnella silvisoli]MCD9024488.1 S8 family serine peptidase [Cohnella silvisoli]